jgi:hypothetical protein
MFVKQESQMGRKKWYVMLSRKVDMVHMSIMSCLIVDKAKTIIVNRS